VTTYSVNQTTGALAVPSGVNPAPIRLAPVSSNQAAVVNSAGTLLFVAGTDSNNVSAISVLSISATGALAELPASPFSLADGTAPTALAITPDGSYLYELSTNNLVNPGFPTNSILDAFSVGSDGTLTPLGNYTLPPSTTILYMHPTGQWLYAYGDASGGVPTIQQLTVGSLGELTLTGNLVLLDESQAEGLVGDSAGKYLFSLRNEEPGGVNLVDTLSVDGSSGGLTLLNTFIPNPPVDAEVLNANEAIDSTNGFLYTSFANFSLSNGIPTLLQENPYSVDAPPLLVASRTSPFLFSTGEVGEDPTICFYSSDVIGSDGTLAPAPGSPYTNTCYPALAVTGSVPVPTEPVLTLSTNSITFSAITPGQSETATVTLSSTGFGTLLFNSISVSGDASFTQTNNCPGSLEAGSMCTVTLKFAPTVTALLPER
jgi:hypothetical protein